MTYKEAPVEVLEKNDHVKRNWKVPLVKVLWDRHSEDEATWGKENYILAKYSDIVRQVKFQGLNYFKWREL